VTSRTKLVRRVSAVLLLLWMGVVVASVLRRQAERRAPTGQVEFGGPTTEGEQPVRVHRGFVYTDTIGIEPNFRIAAQETVEYASGWFEMTDVDVALYSGSEVAYGLTSERARLHRDRREAIATGDVRLSLAGGVVVSAAGVLLRGQERELESQGPATFAGESLGGLAGAVKFRLADSTMLLSGGVSFVWRRPGEEEAAPLIVIAPSAEYSRAAAAVVFGEGATLMRGALRLQGAAVRVQMREAEGELEAITLTGPVEITGTTPAGLAIAGRAGDTELRAGDEGRLQLTADPAPDTGWVGMLLRDPALGWRELNARRLVGEGSRDAWEWVEAQGLACVTDFAPGSGARVLSADRVHVDLAGGRATSAVAEGSVRVEGGDQWAEGDRLSFSGGSQSFSLTPSEGRRVSVGTSEVTCVCDALESADGSNVSARGNVAGVLRRGALWGAGDAPMRFAADGALVSRSGDSLDLDGQARLWQGDRLVRADRIAFTRADEVVNATGNVVTLARTSPGAGGRAGELMQLRSRSLRYEHQAGLAVYEGDVVLEDARSTARCQRLTVTLGSDGQVLLAALDGGVEVDERGGGRTIKAQQGRVDLVRDVLELWGTPVLIQEASGNQVKGSRLEWRRATETIVVFGSEDSPSETIYKAPGATPATARQP
jgi:lipopolysaccharide export system protein LptA